MNVSSILTKDYENIWQRRVRKNKPNSNPNKANFRKAQMNVNSLITKDYRKKDDFAVQKNKPKTNPISSKAKMNANVFVIKDYENETTFRPQKNKPKQSQFHLPPFLAQIQGFAPKIRKKPEKSPKFPRTRLISIAIYVNVGNYKEGFEKPNIANPIFLQVVYELGTFSNFY